MSDKADTLARDWGYLNLTDLVGDTMFDGVVPAICMNEGCDYSTEYEPDQTHGFCENCGTNTCMSAQELMW